MWYRSRSDAAHVRRICLISERSAADFATTIGRMLHDQIGRKRPDAAPNCPYSAWPGRSERFLPALTYINYQKGLHIRHLQKEMTIKLYNYKAAMKYSHYVARLVGHRNILLLTFV